MWRVLRQIARTGIVTEPTPQVTAADGAAAAVQRVHLEGLGIRFVASPRHADLLLVTGPVSRHMAEALRRTYDATPDPKLVIAVGDCGGNGGIFGAGYASCGGVASVIPVDAVVPGCPPPPIEILRTLLAVVRRGAAAAATPHP
jgi:Ni,Fe-hydrogenase III small subunit